MKERKYVKFRVDMYDDTKFKMIDMKPERDLIHYIWARLITLAGKVNLEGVLYLTKNSPYTIETLSIEFNRDIFQVKSALNTLIELEMIEITEDNVYRVKNFAKHQNIKVKEKNNIQDKEVVGNEEVKANQNLEEDNYDNKSTQDKIERNQEGSPRGNEISSIKDAKNLVEQKSINNKGEDLPIILNSKKNKKSDVRKNKSVNKNKDSSITDEEIPHISIDSFVYGDRERTLAPGESYMEQWDF